VEDLMKQIHTASLALALAVSAGAAQAQTTIITEPAPPAAVITAPPAAVVTAPPAVVETAPVVLTPDQRQVIYRTIVQEPQVVQRQVTVGAAAPVVEYTVGARVPSATTLYPIPQDVAVEVPAVRNYRYMVINNRAWLVDPATSEIVAEVSQ
jgi:hypothetical protein